MNRKNPNPNLFKFCSELRNRKSDPVINIFHGGGQNREFCETVSRKQNGGVLKFPFLDRGITSIVKGVDTQFGRHSDNTNFVRSPFSSARLKVLLGVACLPGPGPPFLQCLWALAASRCSSRTCNMVGSSRFHFTIQTCASTMVFSTQKRCTINMVGSSDFHLTIPSCASTMVFTKQKRCAIIMVGSSRFHLTIPPCASTMVFTTQKRRTIK